MIRLSILFSIYGGLSVVTAVDDSWRYNCKVLDNPRAAPFLYLSQSDLAVLAHYSNIDYQRFQNRKAVSFYITPICFVKGYTHEPYLTVMSGTQKCKMTPLSNMIEYPSLFFLRKQSYSDEWLLLNSGEYRHIVDNIGILYGLGPSGNSFPQTCGVNRRRTSIDEPDCAAVKCKAYCSYNVAPPNNCLNKRDKLLKYMAASEIPADVKPHDTSIVATPPPPRRGTGKSEQDPSQGSSTRDGKSQGQKYTDGKNSANATARSVDVKKTSGRNSAPTSLQATCSLVLGLSIASSLFNR